MDNTESCRCEIEKERNLYKRLAEEHIKLNKQLELDIASRDLALKERYGDKQIKLPVFNTGKCRIFQCSVCGYGMDDVYLNDEGKYDMTPKYCPNCGGKVHKQGDKP